MAAPETSGETAEPPVPAAAETPAPAAEGEAPAAPGDGAERPRGPRPPRQGGAQAQAGGKRAPRQREPLPWPELRAAASTVSATSSVDDLKDLFRLLPNDVRDETVDGVREYRKGARRPVSAYAGKSLARAVHTARRARRRPDSDDAVSEALGQALAAEIVASLDVEVAAEVILPKRDLLEREARNARRRQRDEDMKHPRRAPPARPRGRQPGVTTRRARTPAPRSAGSTSSRSCSTSPSRRTRSRSPTRTDGAGRTAIGRA